MQAELYVKVQDKDYLIAVLTQQHPQATLDIHLSVLDNAQIHVKDNGTVHVVGLYDNEVDDDDLEGEELDGEEDEEEEEEEEAAAKPVAKP